MKNDKKPIVYSCSGCSSAAQLANHIAIQMDRAQIAEMSCIAGVGGDVRSLVNTAKSGRRIVALDGCALKCVEHCLQRHAILPDSHFVMSDLGVEKKYHQDFDKHQAEIVYKKIIDELGWDV